MRSDLNGENVQPFFESGSRCSCPDRPSVIPAMTIDKTNIQRPVMYWISLEGHLNVADIHGCYCNVVMSAITSGGLLPISLTVDKIHVFWTVLTKDQIYFSKKEYPSYTNKTNIPKTFVKSFTFLPNVRSIKAFGKSLQPYPTVNCLIPRQLPYNAEKIRETTNSITVKLPTPVFDYEVCEKYNLPTTLYTIYASQCLNEDNKCERIKMQTYEQQYEIRNLKPFTKYKIKLALNNSYGNLDISDGVVLRTGVGTPGRPENLTVQVLTPTLMAVYWTPPKVLNSAAVIYEVHWRSTRLINGVRQKGERLIKDTERMADSRFFTTLQPLLPGEEYAVYVRVYPVHFNEFHNESFNRSVQMYPEPNNLTLSGASMNSLNISWVPSQNLTIGYILEYKDVALEEWQNTTKVNTKKDRMTYCIEGLQPRTLYKFRLVLRYPVYKKNFIWPTDGRFTFQTLGK